MLNVSVHTAQLPCLILVGLFKVIFYSGSPLLIPELKTLAVIASIDIVMQFVKSGDFGNGISCVLHV